MSGVARDRLQPRLLILANAGSGKTHELVTRCIKLLSLGQNPEEILALTFTRKAAAEFLQKLFERLGDAAEDNKARAGLAADLGMDKLSTPQCIAWMHQLLAVLPRLSMGTMDQFFGRIVRGFPFELGMAREFELLDDAAQQENLRLTLERLFRDGATDKKALADLLEMLRQSSRNRSDSSALRGLQQDVTQLHEQIAGPSKDVTWGDAPSIWANPAENAFLSALPLAQAARAFMDEVAATQDGDLSDDFRAYLEEVVDRAMHRDPEAGLGPHLAKFAGYLGKPWKFVKKDNADVLAIGRKGKFFKRGRIVDRCEDFRRALIGAELRSRLSSSAAVHRLLQRYDEIYAQTVRGMGALTFADVTEILTGQSGRLKDSIAYRLDSRHKHWLLDEFQDTSRTQWDVIEPLVSEVLMDSGDERTFFYVGDTKQSIYGWRGGDDRLFREIFHHYNKHRKDHIEEAQLDMSWRSDRAIIEVVNTVFDAEQVEALGGDFNLPPAVAARWKDGWVAHTPRPTAGPGYVRLHDLSVVTTKDDTEAIDRELVRLIRDEIRPIERRLSCAVLTRSGKMAERYAKALEKAGIPAVTEGRFAACKANPESLALLAAVRCVASPCDKVARGHFIASPFGAALRDGDARKNAARFRAEAMASAAGRGFADTVRGWVALTSAVDPSQVAAFIDAAAEFDAKHKPSDDWHSFINHLEHYTLQENESPGVVRVMTVHKAKGLGMDVVVLPDLGGHTSLSQLKLSGISLVRDKEGKVQWGLDLPPSEMCDEDEELRRAREEMRANQSFGEMCVFYVAMTRAKHAVYCLTAERQDRKNAARWLMRTFPAGATGDEIREVGDKEWFRHVKPAEIEPPVVIAGKSIRQSTASKSPAPSAHLGEDVPAAMILGGGAARHLGTEVHELLAQVEWLGDQPDYAGTSAEGAKLAREFLASNRAAFMKSPGDNVTVWRERAFDVEIDGRAVSGIFDRVHILRGKDGAVLEAQVYDFKTDKDPSDLREQYKDQLEDYAYAAAKLLDLPRNKVQSHPIAVRNP
jgi:ATP-dependent helicase/nuclease subunit A